MESRIATALGLRYNPVAVVLGDDKPENALQFKKGRWGCVMFMFANAAKGRTAAFDAETYGCWGGGVGLGFGNAYLRFPGGVECFARFLSSGNKGWEKGKEVARGLEGAAGKEFMDNFLQGEGYTKTPELVNQWVEELPITEIKSTYVLFKPLGEVDLEAETPETVVFLANPDQLSALVILANYGREGMENVIIPWAAGCQTVGILPYREGRSAQPRAVVGLTDISARKYVRNLLGSEYLSFAVPTEMFLEMEANVPGSFLERHTWCSLMEADK
ncbi:MAG: DUF169 domain-containing protein [Desulfobulbaceae bacterium]|jgi:uncharacterized protein (DUF169 family)|nr:DUF169 domain-containing protein [Desulfobulbaceae bacterium]MDY0351438.1 DUF169 domain-containing protein [Desulfobulbaceae bacterium]